MTRLVVGLGNPGPQYEGTRHNVGFLVLDRLAGDRGALFQSARTLPDWPGRTDFEWARLERPEALLVKPLTFMNRSGDAVATLALRYLGHGADIDSTRLMVVYDDLDLGVSKLRIRPFGGAGGHKGMRSIIERLGTDRFPRLRVGVGRPATDAARHVLEPFHPSERTEIEISVAEAADAVLDWLEGGDVEKTMTRFHSRWNQDS